MIEPSRLVEFKKWIRNKERNTGVRDVANRRKFNEAMVLLGGGMKERRGRFILTDPSESLPTKVDNVVDSEGRYMFKSGDYTYTDDPRRRFKARMSPSPKKSSDDASSTRRNRRKHSDRDRDRDRARDRDRDRARGHDRDLGDIAELRREVKKLRRDHDYLRMIVMDPDRSDESR